MSTMIDRAPALIRRDAPQRTSRRRVREVLLLCGILSSLLYAAAVVLGAMRFEGYSSTSQTVSELFAIDAPSRPLIVALFTVYGVLIIAFGIGVWRSAHGKRALQVTGGLLVAYGAVGLPAPPFTPIHLRGVEGTLTDTMHIVVTGVLVLLMLLAIGFGAASLEKRFRLYSVVTMVTLAVFGALAGMDGPRIAANEPTPWAGVFERINIGVFLLWVVVLAVALLRPHVGIRTTTESAE